MSELQREAPSGAARAIVAAHGDLAQGLVNAVAVITGEGAVFHALTNAGLDRDSLESRLREVVQNSGARVVFTDLQGGSWTLAARRLQRMMPELVVVTGTSLPVLLDFVYCDADPAAAARQAVERGRSSLTSVSGPPAAAGA